MRIKGGCPSLRAFSIPHNKFGARGCPSLPAFSIPHNKFGVAHPLRGSWPLIFQLPGNGGGESQLVSGGLIRYLPRLSTHLLLGAVIHFVDWNTPCGEDD